MTPDPVPAWLQPIRDGARTITAGELSRFVPPDDAEARPGAVLMLFGEGEAGPDLLLTERSPDMRSHPGQVSFPGGGVEPHDDGPVAAALREAQEETGLDPAGVEVLASVTVDGHERPVMVRQGRLLASSFHPELMGDHRVHRLFVDLVTS